jgi:hypothetical protein
MRTVFFCVLVTLLASIPLTAFAEMAVVKYDGDGNFLWDFTHGESWWEPRGLATDPDDGFIVLCREGAHSTPFLFRGDDDGTILWQANPEPGVYALGLDSGGNSFVTGIDEGDDFHTAKFDPSGIVLWEKTYGGPDDAHDFPFEVVVDDSGNAFVMGTSRSEEEKPVFQLVKYTPSGTQAWVKRYDDTSEVHHNPTDFTVDSDGNVLIAGSSREWSKNNDYLTTIKYNTSGTVLWNETYDDEFDLRTIEVDDSGNVYLAGGDDNFTAIKYDSDGAFQWRISYGNNDSGVAQDLAADSAGNLVIAGNVTEDSHPNPSLRDYTIVQVDSDGSFVWDWFYTTAKQAQIGRAMAVAIGQDENIYATGRTCDYDLQEEETVGEECHYLTVKLSSSGAEIWTALYDQGPEGDREKADYLAIASDGNIYVAGGVYPTSPGEDDDDDDDDVTDDDDDDDNDDNDDDDQVDDDDDDNDDDDGGCCG